ncbi:SLATT domain-containing protein [Spirillospora sp. CA-294931]|uniref:SLATT domain-containing protein n=1 Tax=Spirillospora sp. CA-294931 TaxID=3240042 RepID=UPI003D8E39CE
MIKAREAKPLLKELDALYEDATYTATTYFEAVKSAEFWGKLLVFLPATISALAGFSVALGASRRLGTLSAVAGVIAATGAFLGAESKGPSFKESARSFTALRHTIRLEQRIALRAPSFGDLEKTVRSLREEYNDLVLKGEPTSNRLFRRAQKRITKGMLSYDYEIEQD